MKLQAAERCFARTDAVVRAAVGTVFTGAVARVEHRGRLVFERAYGRTRNDELGRQVYVDTPFDLASITKVFVGTLALRAIDDGAISLDDRLARWFESWRGTPHEAITLRMLLAHNSGMNSGADFRQLLGKNVVEYTLTRELADAPRARVIYSDLGFIALGALLERMYGRSLGALIRDLHPGVAYRPAAGMRPAIPATEDDGWRGRVQGVVHDEKAYLMGGEAGHAGLFGTAQDVAWLAEQYLGRICGRPSNRTVRIDLVREATTQQAWDPVLRRGLAWALKTSDDNSCGRYFSESSFGHTGFVGTCVWSDPERDCTGVLLTNSVYYGRNDTRELRAAFYEALMDELSG